MITYNVTVSVDKAIEAEWVQWMKGEHINKVIATGLFGGYKFYKVLSHDDPATSTYCAMYFAPTLNDFVKYLNDFAPALRAEADVKFPGKFAAFRTLLEEVS